MCDCVRCSHSLAYILALTTHPDSKTRQAALVLMCRWWTRERPRGQGHARGDARDPRRDRKGRGQHLQQHAEDCAAGGHWRCGHSFPTLITSRRSTTWRPYHGSSCARCDQPEVARAAAACMERVMSVIRGSQHGQSVARPPLASRPSSEGQHRRVTGLNPGTIAEAAREAAIVRAERQRERAEREREAARIAEEQAREAERLAEEMARRAAEEAEEGLGGQRRRRARRRNVRSTRRSRCSRPHVAWGRAASSANN